MARRRAQSPTDQKKLIAILEQRMREARQERTRRHGELASKITVALQTSSQPKQSQAPNFAGTTIAGNAVYISAATILTASDALINEYQRLDGMITGLQNERVEPVAETWKQNIIETEAQLTMGARVALRNVTKVLGAEVSGEDLKTTDENGDVEMRKGEEMEEMQLNYDLHKSLRYAERGVKRMVKGLPDDEGR